jgi:hypothetical protein
MIKLFVCRLSNCSEPAGRDGLCESHSARLLSEAEQRAVSLVDAAVSKRSVRIAPRRERR